MNRNKKGNTMTIKMECNVYWNSQGFKVGRKYLSIYNAETQTVIDRILLTEALRKDLSDIKEEYESDDVNRTVSVMLVFSEHLHENNLKKLLKRTERA